jgi:hypothetical protein
MGESSPAEDVHPQPGWYRDPHSPASWRWWDGQAWSPHTATSGDLQWSGGPPIRPYNDPNLASGLLQFVLLAAGLVALAGVATRLVEWPLLAEIAADPAGVTNGEIQDDSNRVLAPWVTEWFTLIFGVLAAALWTNVVYANLPSLGVSGLRFGRGWAAGGYFLPVVNFFRPVQVLGDVWRGSDPDPAAAQVNWHRRPASRLVIAWFILSWLAVGFHWATFPLVQVEHDLPGNLGTPGGVPYDSTALRANSIASAVGHALVLVACVLGLVMVRSLTKRQRVLAGRLGVMAPSRYRIDQPGHPLEPERWGLPPDQSYSPPIGESPQAALVRCPQGHPNPNAQKFCSQCGVSLAAAGQVICPNGHANPPASQFCGECATALDPRASQPVQPPPPGGDVVARPPGQPAVGQKPVTSGQSADRWPPPAPPDPTPAEWGAGWVKPVIGDPAPSPPGSSRPPRKTTLPLRPTDARATQPAEQSIPDSSIGDHPSEQPKLDKDLTTPGHLADLRPTPPPTPSPAEWGAGWVKPAVDDRTSSLQGPSRPARWLGPRVRRATEAFLEPGEALLAYASSGPIIRYPWVFALPVAVWVAVILFTGYILRPGFLLWGFLAWYLMVLFYKKYCVAVTDQRVLIIAVSLSGEPKRVVFAAPRDNASASVEQIRPLIGGTRIKIGGIKLTLNRRIWRMGEIGAIVQALTSPTHHRPPLTRKDDERSS